MYQIIPYIKYSSQLLLFLSIMIKVQKYRRKPLSFCEFSPEWKDIEIKKPANNKVLAIC